MDYHLHTVLAGHTRINSAGHAYEYNANVCRSIRREGWVTNMDFKQSTIDDILDSEREMVLRGAERYGAYFGNAIAFTNLLGTGMIKSIKGDCFLFAVFVSQIRKHLTLALFSALRLHHVQMMMNLRQVLEGGACAAYAIAHTDPADFVDAKSDGTLDPSQKLAKKRYDWLNENFPAGSEGIKRQKESINEIGAHANLVTAHQTFKPDFESGQFHTPFFDYEDEVHVRTDLWLVANISLGLMDLFYGVNEKLAVIQLQDSWRENFQKLAAENDRLKDEMLAHERLAKYGKPRVEVTVTKT